MRCLDCGLLDYNEVLTDPDTGTPFCGLCGAIDVFLDLIEAEVVQGAIEDGADEQCAGCGSVFCLAGEDCDGIPY